MPSSPKHKKKPAEDANPSEELLRRLQELENGIQEARNAVVAEILRSNAKPAQPAAHTPSGFGRFFRRRSDLTATATPPKKANAAGQVGTSVGGDPPADFFASPAPEGASGNNGEPQPPAASTPTPTSHSLHSPPELAVFVDIPESEALVENLRRVAELVVYGENFVTSLQRKEEAAFLRAKEKWRSRQLDVLGDDDEEDEGEDGSDASNAKDGNKDEYVQLFDLFFERNALDLVISLLTGTAFELSEDDKKQIDDQEDSLASMEGTEEANKEGNPSPAPKLPRRSEQLAKCRRIPRFPIATQALQSVSILIQNVSRATSLYVILSNNRINELINLPLDLYMEAERRSRASAGSDSAQAQPVSFASPEITELSTHFVTFLKSLAMRMNAQTLQFFLKYPVDARVPRFNDETSMSNDLDDEPGLPDIAPVSHGPHPSAKIEFPLYERALEFCAAHQDSFIRVTAMNICLNTLRLATVAEPGELDDDIEPARPPESPRAPRSPLAAIGSSPDGVLHNAKPLPFRERLGIAHFTCIPSRVERLVSPILTKLAERWNSLDEKIREIEGNMFEVSDVDLGPSINKLARAKETVRRERLLRHLRDQAADMQDELLLLEDVFKVGLTVLNEQMIEMMFATFIYPLLLQPLLLYYQRLGSPSQNPTFTHGAEYPFGGSVYDAPEKERALASVSSPAKAALFSICGVFEALSNKPLLRLLFTALLHPLSPDTSGVPTLRTSLEVSTVTPRGRSLIRLDHNNPKMNDVRSTYDFGTTPGNRRQSKFDSQFAAVPEGDTEACVFVLSPALAEVLEFNGDDISLFARTRPNPYRRAIVEILGGPPSISSVRSLAVVAINSAVQRLDSQFRVDIAFGSGLKALSSDVPLDESALDSISAHSEDDRGIGGGASHESRTTLERQKAGTTGLDLTAEVVRALCRCTVVGEHKRQSVAEWVLKYDDVAAHNLLCFVQGNARATDLASKAVEHIWRQSSRFVAELFGKIHPPMGGSSIPLEGCPSINDPGFDHFVEGVVANYIIFEGMDPRDRSPAVNALLQLSFHGSDLSIGISCEGSFEDMCSRIGQRLLGGLGMDGQVDLNDKDEVHLARQSMISIFKVDALLWLLKEMAAAGGRVLDDVAPSGLVLSTGGGIAVSMKDCHESNLDKQMFAPLSTQLAQDLFPTASATLAQTGSSMDLSGKPLLPCVCEAPASLSSLFSGDGLGVVSEGVTWQSLYLVFTDGALVVAQPLPDGDGRVITSCHLEQLSVQLDTLTPDDGPPARRLILSNASFEPAPPTLFRYDAEPQDEKLGPLTRVQSCVSTLDVWFEDQAAADHAYQILTNQILASKSQRGRMMKERLSPGWSAAATES